MEREVVPKSALHKALSLITDIEPQEIRRALMLTANFFVLFTAYYVVKPIREGLILSMSGGAELKSSAAAYQALAFMILVPLYTVLTRRFSGRGVIAFVYLFMAANILVLMALGLAEFHYLGVIFYLWVGVFNVLTISQTWSLCNELYTPEQGKRIFALIALGATSGAAFGSLVLRSLIPIIGLFSPMVVAAALLVVSAFIIWFGLNGTSRLKPPLEQPESSEGIFQKLLGGLWLVFTNRYIALIAGLILISNLINTNSEYMLGKMVSNHFREQITQGLAGGATLKELIGDFYARFFFWVNIVVLVVQAFFVSRIIKRAGIGPALLLMPVLALFSYSLIVMLPILAVLRIVKIAENATDYSLNNTAREILFLPLTLKEKYKAKLASDTVFRRGGDALSRPAVFLITEKLGYGIAAFAGLNIALVLIWIVLVWRIAVHHRMKMKKKSGY